MLNGRSVSAAGGNEPENSMARFLERRLLLRGAGVVGATAGGLSATEEVASAHGRDHRQGPLGAWKIKRTEPQGTELTVAAIFGFAAGGVFTGQDINPVSYTYLGAWESHGSHHGDRVGRHPRAGQRPARSLPRPSYPG